MGVQIPATTTGSVGQTRSCTNLHFLDLIPQTKTGFPTLDANFKLIHSTPTDVAKLTDWSEALEQDGYLFAMLMLSYICDMWTETANRIALPTERAGDGGTLTGLVNGVLGTLA